MSDQRVETIEYRGIRYRRYPDSPAPSQARYFIAGIADRQAGRATRLHADIYRDNWGEIPDGYEVHHIDGDHDNNDPMNLEAIPEEDHKAHHRDERLASGAYSAPARLEHLERIRPLTKAWHGSSDGLAWHAEHGRRTWEEREPTTGRCDFCDAPYSIKLVDGEAVRFCSNACKSAWRRREGLDDEDRACARPACGATFRCNRYAKTRYCTRSCGAKHRHERQAAAG